MQVRRRTIYIGWTERKKDKDGEKTWGPHKGVLDGFEIDRKGAEEMIMAARIEAVLGHKADLDD